jgi:hypothetical protein
MFKFLSFFGSLTFLEFEKKVTRGKELEIWPRLPKLYPGTVFTLL